MGHTPSCVRSTRTYGLHDATLYFAITCFNIFKSLRRSQRLLYGGCKSVAVAAAVAKNSLTASVRLCVYSRSPPPPALPREGGIMGWMAGVELRRQLDKETQFAAVISSFNPLN